MAIIPSLLAFCAAAMLLAITPGLDTAMVLHSAVAGGPRQAILTAIGIAGGCLVWGAAVAFGLGVVLTASALAYMIVKWAGAAYLLWLGAKLLLHPRDGVVDDTVPAVVAVGIVGQQQRSGPVPANDVPHRRLDDRRTKHHSVEHALTLRAGAVAYLGEGHTRWAAAHVSDVAKLYVLKLEKGEPSARYHAAVEEGVTARAVAEAIGKGTGLPVRLGRS